MKKFLIAACAVAAISGLAIASLVNSLPPPLSWFGSPPLAQDTHLTPDDTYAPFARSESSSLTRGLSLSQALQKLGLEAPERLPLLEKISETQDLDRLPEGFPIIAYYVASHDTVPRRVELRPDDITTRIFDLRIKKPIPFKEAAEFAWQETVRKSLVETKVEAYAGAVDFTLWDSAKNAGLDGTVITKLTDIFGWQFDFNRQVSENDRWRLTIERQYIDGKPAAYGDIIAAEYTHQEATLSAVRFIEDGKTRYYAPDGSSLERMFLKSPLKFGRITSGFAPRRFHPILKVSKPHLGIDYGAPTGTPVLAVGDGVVSFAAPRGPSGNMVTLKHSGGYQTIYKHLSRFAVKTGSQVKMGEVIGYVGATGLATGPHLHYEFHEGTRVVDPQKLDFPQATMLAAKHRKAFKEAATLAMGELPPWEQTVLLTDASRLNQQRHKRPKI